MDTSARASGFGGDCGSGRVWRIMAAMAADVQDVGVVVIGRNEARDLGASPRLGTGRPATIVCVDSALTDDGPAIARDAGAVVVELDLATPIIAARARHAGFQRLL